MNTPQECAATGEHAVDNSIDTEPGTSKKQDNHVDTVGQHDANHTNLPDNFVERRDLQQYFFTRDTLTTIANAIMHFYEYDIERIEKELCLICTPTLAKVDANIIFIITLLCSFYSRNMASVHAC